VTPGVRGAGAPFALRIVLADDHTLLLEALRILLAPVGTVVATAGTGDELVARIREFTPDLVITDLSMPGVSGFTALQAIQKLPEPPPVVVLSVHADPGTIRAALRAGARGYVSKVAASAELLAAVAMVCSGGTYIPPELRVAVGSDPVAERPLITPRQREVLEALSQGLTSKQIARHLGISERTVGFHRDELRRRLGIRTVSQMLDLLRRVSEEAGEA